MALIDKNIVITPNRGLANDPRIDFVGATASLGPQVISVYALPDNNGTLSFEGSAGQLFSITNDLSGTIFSVNDISGIPSIEVDSNGTIKLAEFSGNVGIGTSSPTERLHVDGKIRIGTQATATTDAVRADRTITAGNGLTGGGNLTANRTITLGTPETITTTSTNSVSASGHSHALTLPASATRGEISEADLTNGTSATIGFITGRRFAAALASANVGQVANSLSAGSFIVGDSFNGSTARTWNINATSANTANAIVARDGSGNFSANIMTGTATQARYADLAERYAIDQPAQPGTVVVFGGDQEITQSTTANDHRVVGVVSTDPAYLMNCDAGDDQTHPAIALTGRVPVRVTGVVNPGDLMVTSDIPGHAQADNHAQPGRIIGKAIGKNAGGEGIIEVLITLM